MSASERRPLPRRFLKASESRSESVANKVVLWSVGGRTQVGASTGVPISKVRSSALERWLSGGRSRRVGALLVCCGVTVGMVLLTALATYHMQRSLDLAG